MNLNTLLILGAIYFLISKKDKKSAPVVQVPTQDELMKQAHEAIKQAQDAISSI